jgi:PAS domain S-box-containing protein
MSNEKEMVDSEEKYRLLFKYSLNGIAFHEIVYDSNAKPINYVITDVNPKYESLLSIKKEDAINMSATDVYKTDNPPYLEIFAKVADTLEPASFTPFFEPMNKHFKISAFSFEKGKFITVFEDITKQLQATSKIAESEKKYRNIIENTSDAITIIGLDGKIKFISPQFSSILGKEINTEDNYLKNIHPDDRSILTNLYNRALKEKSLKKAEIFEFRIKHADGHYVWLFNSAKNYYDDNGNVVGFISVIRDITDKKMAEQKLKESEENLRQLSEVLEQRVNQRTQELLKSKEGFKELFNTIPDGIAISNMEGEILDANQVLQNMLGYSLDELKGMDFSQITPEKWRESENKAMEDFMARGSGSFEKEYIRKDGKILPISLSGWLIKNEQGIPTKVGAFIKYIK